MGNCRSMKEILNIIKFLEIHHIEIILPYIFIQSAIWKKTFSIFNSLFWTEKKNKDTIRSLRKRATLYVKKKLFKTKCYKSRKRHSPSDLEASFSLDIEQNTSFWFSAPQYRQLCILHHWTSEALCDSAGHWGGALCRYADEEAGFPCSVKVA